MSTLQKILLEGSKAEQRVLFAFDGTTEADDIRKKFKIFSRNFFPEFFIDPVTQVGLKDAPWHKDMDLGNINAYIGKESSYLNIAFRNSAKTTRTKLFIVFAVLNDESHRKKFFKILSKDSTNSRKSVTDIYNLLINRRIKALYPGLFDKTDQKREETMSAFTTTTGIHVTSDSVGTDQRGDIQQASRPDFLWFDDFETSNTLMSAPITFKLWANMEEARTGLAKDGCAIYTCNYLSERGNVHKLVLKLKHQTIIPIEKDGVPTWDRFTKEDIDRLRRETSDFVGEYMCQPSASKDVYFDRASVDKQIPKLPIDEIAGLKIWRHYDPSHRIGSGHDVSGGVGLDSSTSVFIDFDAYPMQVIATYQNNEVKPDAFAYVIQSQAKRFGENMVAVEKNYASTLDILKGIYPSDKIYKTQRDKPKITFQAPTEYGFETNRATKPKILSDLTQIIESGHIELNDPDLIAELRSYTTGDLMDREVDPRLTTRHFDLLMALAIALQTNTFIKKASKPKVEDYWLPSNPRFQRLKKIIKGNPAR